MKPTENANRTADRDQGPLVAILARIVRRIVADESAPAPLQERQPERAAA